MLHLLTSVQTNLEAYPSRTPLQLAKFYTRHSTEIYEMIPGCECTSHKKLMDEFRFFFKQAEETIQIA
jgi:hypothetical protein